MSKVKCPKCNSNMINNCCVKCGYMSNGSVSGAFTLPDKNEDLKLYNKDFDKLNMNENKFFLFLFQSSYIAYQDHFLFSILISLIYSIIDIVIVLFYYFIFVIALGRINAALALLFPVMVLVHFFIKRVIYVMFANMICLKLDKLKIKKLKEKNDNYKVILKNNKNTNIISLCASMLINFIILVMKFIIFITLINLWFYD